MRSLFPISLHLTQAFDGIKLDGENTLSLPTRYTQDIQSRCHRLSSPVPSHQLFQLEFRTRCVSGRHQQHTMGRFLHKPTAEAMSPSSFCPARRPLSIHCQPSYTQGDRPSPTPTSSRQWCNLIRGINTKSLCCVHASLPVIKSPFP